MKSQRTRVGEGESRPQAEEHHQTCGPEQLLKAAAGSSQQQPGQQELGMGVRVMQPGVNRLGEVRAEQGLSELTGQQAFVKWFSSGADSSCLAALACLLHF